jgi:aryl-alcohol dehydrogenase-like predicted oxidoreductase
MSLMHTASAYAELEAVLRSEPLDFVQLNYSVADRAAEQRLPPLAAELECTSWAQLLLKFVIGHPAVTCAIPGTGDAAHMADNALAGRGPMPDAAARARIVRCWHAARG